MTAEITLTFCYLFNPYNNIIDILDSVTGNISAAQPCEQWILQCVQVIVVWRCQHVLGVRRQSFQRLKSETEIFFYVNKMDTDERSQKDLFSLLSYLDIYTVVQWP